MGEAATLTRPAGPTARTNRSTGLAAQRAFAPRRAPEAERRESACEAVKPAPRAPSFSFGRLPIQPKLVVGAVDDPLEREADAVAEKVMRMPDPALSLRAAPLQVSRKCAECEKEDEDRKLRMKPAGVAAPATSEAPPIVHDVLRSPGQPLDAETRGFFEPRFGYDFSQVRLHTDETAAASARAIDARAYTVGHDIVIGAGQPSRRAAANSLLAHELAHVTQQRAAPISELQRQADSSADAATPGTTPLGPPSLTGVAPVDACATLAAMRPFLDGCKAATSHFQASLLHDNLVGCWVPAVSLKLGSETGSVWLDYLDSKKPLPRPKRIFTGSGEIVDGFTKHHRTAEAEVEITKAAAATLSPTPSVPLPAPGATSTVPLTSVVPAATLHTRLNDPKDPAGLIYDDPVNTVPGNLAGGLSGGGPPGNTAVDPDTRDVDGTLDLSLDATGTSLTIKPSLSFTIHDTVDFCPGGLGKGLATIFTFPMSMLEATEGRFGPIFAADVPFDVVHPGPGLASRTVTITPSPAPTPSCPPCPENPRTPGCAPCTPPSCPPCPEDPRTPGCPLCYTVVEGDYLIKIATDLCGDPEKWKDIYQANSSVIGANPDLIFPGQVFVIPCASAPAP